MTPAWQQLERVVQAASPVPSDPVDVAEPVARYFAAALPDGLVAAQAAVLEMRGQIKIGRWLPFRARQLLAPRHGTVWEARVGGVIIGSDRYVAGAGGMTWKLFGLIPFVTAKGSDVTRSAAGRASGESIWVPSAVAPSTGTVWTAISDQRVAADIDTDGHTVRVEHDLDAAGRMVCSSFLRWGDPERTGSWGEHRFGVEVHDHRRFGAVVIPNAGVAGWHFGSDGWPDGMFFRFRITSWMPYP